MYKGTIRRGGLVDGPYFQAMIEIDCDAGAEIVSVADRQLREFNFSQVVVAGTTNKIIVPLAYASASNLFAVIFDNDRNFNAAIIDGIKAKIIDGKVTSIRP